MSIYDIEAALKQNELERLEALRQGSLVRLIELMVARNHLLEALIACYKGAA